MNLHHVNPMRSLRLLPLSSLLLVAMLLPSAASSAATLIDTNFEDGTIQGWQNDFYSTSKPSRTVPPSDGNQYLQVSGGGHFRGVYHFLSTPLTLSVGDTISVSFKLMFTSSTDNVRFGLFQYASGDTEDGTSDNGYFASVSVGGTSASIARDGDGTTDPTSGSTNSITPTSSTPASVAFTTNTWYDASITLTVISATGMQVTATIGDASVTGTRPSGNFTNFGMLYIGSGDNNPNLNIDDVLVTTTAAIPEPGITAAFAGLIALAGVALLRLRRHRRGL